MSRKWLVLFWASKWYVSVEGPLMGIDHVIAHPFKTKKASLEHIAQVDACDSSTIEIVDPEGNLSRTTVRFLWEMK